MLRLRLTQLHVRDIHPLIVAYLGQGMLRKDMPRVASHSQEFPFLCHPEHMTV